MKTFLISFSFIVLTLTALGTTVSTPASVATRGLRMVITKYLANGGDINALTMEQVIKMVDVEAANSTAQGKFEDRFEILGGSGPVDQATTAKMIAYTANRIGEDRRDAPGRYVIWLAGGEVNYNWESEEKVAALLGNAGMKLIDRGAWNQPDTKAQSMFHVGVGPKPPPDDNRAQEDQAGRRLSIPNANSQNDHQQSAARQPDTTSEPRTAPVATPKEPKARPSPSEETTSSTPWSAVVVLIVAATGLLWLLLKRRS
jgi:hypothetical protein